MRLASETRDIMESFADYVRSGQPGDIPGVRKDRIHHYRRLVRNVFEDTLRQAYPITFEILSDAEWQTLIDEFMARHQAKSYQVWKMPFEFYKFTVNQNFAHRFHKPYLNDLLYFEWIEIEVYTMPDAPLPQFELQGDLLTDRLVLNKDYRLIELEYPVFKMPAKEANKNKGHYFLLVFRTIDEGVVRFVEINPLLTLFWEALAPKPQTSLTVLNDVARVLKVEKIDPLIQIILPFLNDMLLQGGILGFQKSF